MLNSVWQMNLGRPWLLNRRPLSCFQENYSNTSLLDDDRWDEESEIVVQAMSHTGTAIKAPWTLPCGQSAIFSGVATALRRRNTFRNFPGYFSFGFSTSVSARKLRPLRRLVRRTPNPWRLPTGGAIGPR